MTLSIVPAYRGHAGTRMPFAPAAPMPIRILLADDHPVVALGVRTMLQANPLARGSRIVGEADSAQALFALLRSTPCDLVITDFSMPGSQSDGLNMIRQLRRQYPALSIILLTMVSNAGILQSAVNYGVRGIVRKSSSVKDLPQAIHHVMQGKSFFSVGFHEELEQSPNRPGIVPLCKLSPRENEVVRMLASGMTVSAIAGRLHRSVSTVSRQKGAAMRKLGLHNDADFFSYAREYGLMS